MSLRPAWNKTTADWCLHALAECNFITIEHTQLARVGLIEDRKAIFFQYSNDTQDWIDNLSACLRKVKTPDGREAKAHTGFLAQFEVACRLTQLGDTDLFIGHSLGAALATLCGWYWRKPVIAMASPRVGDADFAKQASPYVLRVQNKGDPVPHLPTWWMGYRHAGQVVKLPPRKRNLFGWLFGDWEVHLPGNYVQSINVARERTL